jgi:integrase
MASKLTDLKVLNVKPNPNKRLEISDAGKPGLHLIVQPNGKKSWAVRYRRLSDRKPRKFTLDGFPSLGVARSLAQDVLDKIASGLDPAADKVIEKQRAHTADPRDVESAFVEFMKRHVRKRNGQPIRWSTRCETARLLGLKPDSDGWIRTGNGVLQHWRGRTVESIRKSDVLTLIDNLAESTPIRANRTLAALKTFFGWCIKRDLLTQSPCAGVDDPSPEVRRERPLSDTELAALWRAADVDGYPFGPMLRLILLTGCRCDEVREALWAEFNLPKRKWLIPGARTKNGHEHLVPLSDTAYDLIKGLPRVAGKALLFTTTGTTAASGTAVFKRRLDKRMLVELREIDPKAKLAPWRIHDLRHTFKSWLQMARVPKDVRDAVQNHHSGSMDQYYGHYSFETEKREALDRWADHIEKISSRRRKRAA